MQVNGVDHVNIFTDDIETTVSFFEALMGLRRDVSPAQSMGRKGAWLRDSLNNAIIHISWRDPDHEFGAGHEPGLSTNAVHHVAFRCSGFDDALERVQAMGIEHRANGEVRFGVRQIFVKDPNNINVELNFAGD